MTSSTRTGGGNRWLWIAAAMAAVAAGVGLGLLPSSAAAQESKPLVLAVHPYLPALEIERRFAPLARHLRQPTTIEISALPIIWPIKRVGTHSVDIAYIGPATYVTLVKTYGREFFLLAQETAAPRLSTAISSSPKQATKTLADAAVRLPSAIPIDHEPSAPYYMLLEAGVKPDDLSRHPFLGGHRNVALAPVRRFCRRRGQGDIYEYRARGLRSIAVSPPIPDHP